MPPRRMKCSKRARINPANKIPQPTQKPLLFLICCFHTTSREIIEKLHFFKKEIITFEEKNTTYRAKARYFELFPISGLKFLIPREIFILNKNLDAISALIILEDYCKMKFTLNQNIDFKTWLK